MGAVVDIVSTGFTDLECLLRIQNPNMCTTFEVAVETYDEAEQWMQSIIETAQNASARVRLYAPFPNSHYLFFCRSDYNKITLIT